MRFTKFSKIITILNKAIELIIAETGLFAPFFILVAVLTIAPVTGIPPIAAEAIFAKPCPTSSVFELCLSFVIPSATTADKSDSIPAKTAIVIDAGIKDLISSKLIPSIFTKVIFKSKLPNLEPMVSAGMAKKLN